MNDERGDSDLEKQIDTLKTRVKDLEEINEGHRMLNGELRKEIFTWKKSASELEKAKNLLQGYNCLLYTSPSPRDGLLSRMPSSA